MQQNRVHHQVRYQRRLFGCSCMNDQLIIELYMTKLRHSVLEHA